MKSASKSLKIGLVLDDSLDVPDGVQQYILTIGGWLTRQGHDVHYLVGQTTRQDIANLHSLGKNVKVRFNKNRMTMPLPTSRKKLAALLAAEQFDVLHVQMPYSPFLAGRLIAAAPATTAVVGTFHIAPHSRAVTVANHVLYALTRRTLKRFDAIMSVSPVAQQFAQQTFGIQSSVIPNTVDLEPFTDAQPLGQYKDIATVMFLGRLVERKGCLHLLHAIAYLQKFQLTLLPFRVVICGKGPLEHQLKAFVRDNDLDDIVEFAGFIEEADKPAYLASADIAVYPSTGGESFGIVLLEAMAAGRGALLAGDNPGYRSVMQPFADSLVNPTHTADFAQKIADLLNNPQERQVLRKKQRIVVSQYDVPVVGARIIAQYRAALHKRRG
jgi:phosphatidyl-myo-inositol alpha-mannosyltransferase